jgi:hypothetical protein
VIRIDGLSEKSVRFLKINFAFQKNGIFPDFFKEGNLIKISILDDILDIYLDLFRLFFDCFD